MKATIRISDIAIKSLAQNIRRTILTIITVALSVALMFVVLTYLYSDAQRQKRAAVEEIGAHHVQYNNISEHQLNSIISNNNLIKKYYTMYIPANIDVKGLLDRNISTAIFCSDGITNGLLKIKEGKEPSFANEIVLDGWVIEDLGLEQKIGQDVTLDFEVVNNNTKIKEVKTIKMKIVGIFEDIGTRKAAKAGMMLVSKEFLKQYSSNNQIMLSVLLNTDYNASKIVRKIAKDVGIKNDQIVINERYIQAYEIDTNSIITAVTIILFIVFIAAIVIFNIFYIYISQKIRLFGILKAIGATKYQLRRLIYTEGAIMAIFGSLLGVITGVFLSLVSVPLLGNATDISTAMRVEFSPYITISSFFIGIIMVFISISSPARVVSKISEIDAIRYNPNKVYNKKTTKNKMKDVVNVKTLILANLSRNKKRTILAILSITLAGLIFLIASSTLSSMNVNNMVSMMIRGDYKLSCVDTLRRDTQSDPLKSSILASINSIDGVAEVYTEMYEKLIYNKKDALNHIEFKKQVGNRISADFYGYDNALLEVAINSLAEGSVTVDEMKDNNYLIAVEDENKTYSVGDKIRLAKYDDKELNHEFEFIIIATVPTYITYKGNGSDGGLFICHQSLFKALDLDKRIKQLSITAEKGKKDFVERALKEIAQSDKKIELLSFKDLFDEYNGMKKTMETTAYAFITVLILIGIFNLVNTTVTSIISRNREISMLEAVGMSRVQLTTQLLSEGLISVIISLIIILSIGIPAGYYIVEVFRKEATYAIYRFPLIPIIIIVSAYVITQIIVTLYIQKNLHKHSIMDRIKDIE